MQDQRIYSLVKNGKRQELHPPYTSINNLLITQAKNHADKPAIVFATEQVKTITYRGLEIETRNIVTLLQRRWSIKAGDRIAYAFENTPEVLLLNFAAWRMGAVTVPLDTKRDTLERKIFKLSLTDAKLLFTTEENENKEIKKQTNVPIITDDVRALANEQKVSKARLANTGLDNECLILFTSGTTADPKGARLTPRSLLANAASIAGWLNITESDRFHVVLPLHHINSTTFANTLLLQGGTIILSPRYSKSGFWATMAAHRATSSSIVPTIAYDLLTEEASFQKHKSDLKQVSRIQIGSAPVQPTVVEEFVKKFHIPLVQGYGQTETSLRSTGVPYQDLTPEQFRTIRQENSIGAELKYTNVTALDKKGNEVQEGEVGEICVRGPIIMKGYLNNESATREAFAHGWFHSGDLGFWKTMFGKKFFFLKGRTKEIIHKGGILISPLAVENALLKAYPALKTAYVIGFPDARLGEEIGLITTTEDKKLHETIINDGKKGTIPTLSEYESPKQIVYVQEGDLPKTATGKIQRITLKQDYAQKLRTNNLTIAESEDVILRRIEPDEKTALKQALEINNARWGKALASTLEEFENRARNGILIGAFNKKTGRVEGSVSAIQITQDDRKKIGARGHWTSTWDGVTAGGTLATHNHKGDVVLCVAISARAQRTRTSEKSAIQQPLTRKKLQDYLESDTDAVMRFHHRPKGGFDKGAELVVILPAARPKDREALGYNVLLRYPTLSHKPTLSHEPYVGTMLIEAALIWAHDHGLHDVLVYSRPGDASKHFKSP